MLYNQDRATDDKNEELQWLFDVVRSLKDDTKYNHLQLLAVSIIIKVYFDFGYNFVVQNAELIKELRKST